MANNVIGSPNQPNIAIVPAIAIEGIHRRRMVFGAPKHRHKNNPAIANESIFNQAALFLVC
ncbi:hypothetical protein BV011_01133 [Haemophilus influenzae]|nr:hypothetical protein BV011_01133 [Haemophilus influenzae]